MSNVAWWRLLYSAWAWTFLYRRFRRRNCTYAALRLPHCLVVKTFSVKLLFSLDLEVEERPNPRRRARARSRDIPARATPRARLHRAYPPSQDARSRSARERPGPGRRFRLAAGRTPAFRRPCRPRPSQSRRRRRLSPESSSSSGLKVVCSPPGMKPKLRLVQGIVDRLDLTSEKVRTFFVNFRFKPPYSPAQ